MSADIRARGKRMSAADRRAEILLAAAAEFGRCGLHGTSTETIATRAGVSQPYLFRLFGTKKDLFVATVERGFECVESAFMQVEANQGEDILQAMGRTYRQLLSERDQLLLQMQAYAACGDPEIQRVVRRRFASLYRQVSERSGASEDRIREFFARGMLLNVAASIDFPKLAVFSEPGRQEDVHATYRPTNLNVTI